MYSQRRSFSVPLINISIDSIQSMLLVGKRLEYKVTEKV